jgi:uncharacterized lipoprotein YehR (DUF1307 family)
MPEVQLTNKQKEAWIDLVTLATRITYQICECKERVVIEHHNIQTSEMFLYQLRVALRAVGHKMTSWTTATEDNGKDIVICYTTITNADVYKQAINLWEEWISETGVDDDCDCRDECDCESESESEPDENPSN